MNTGDGQLRREAGKRILRGSQDCKDVIFSQRFHTNDLGIPNPLPNGQDLGLNLASRTLILANNIYLWL